MNQSRFYLKNKKKTTNFLVTQCDGLQFDALQSGGWGSGIKILERMGTKAFSKKNCSTTTLHFFLSVYTARHIIIQRYNSVIS